MIAKHIHFLSQYLQTSHAVWKFAQNGQVPPEAISFGKTRDGEDLYMGRVMHDGSLTPGKVNLIFKNIIAINVYSLTV